LKDEKEKEAFTVSCFLNKMCLKDSIAYLKMVSEYINFIFHSAAKFGLLLCITKHLFTISDWKATEW